MSADPTTTREIAGASTNAARRGFTSSVVFAADGGIVPAISVVSRELAQACGKRVWLVYGHRAGEHPQELEKLLALKDQHLDRFALTVIMDREPDEAELLSGELDASKIQALGAQLFDAKGVRGYFICGTDQFAADVQLALGGLGVEPARIHVERSAVRETQRPVADAAGLRETQVSFVMDGRRRSFVMRTGEESILDAAARAGIELPFSCKAGVCSTCRTKLVRGEVDLVENYALEDWELAQGFILACQARARTREIELTYDET